MPDTVAAQHGRMDQPLNSPQQDRYRGIPLGVESAWLPVSGAPMEVQSPASSSSSSSKRDSGIGAAFSLRAVRGALAALLLAASQFAGAAPYAPSEYDFSDLSGTVEAVREVSIRREPGELADVLEHAVQPETGEALVIRLDNGRLIIVMQEGAQRFHPGERVRLLGGRLLRS